jgi:hypothetical protein
MIELLLARSSELLELSEPLKLSELSYPMNRVDLL